MKKIFIVCAMALAMANSAFAQEEKEFYGLANRVGVGIGAGTEGIGVDAAVSLTKWCSVRFGLNFMPDINIKTDVDVDYRHYVSENFINASGLPNDGKMEVKGSLARTTIDLKADLYPFPNASSFFITGGFSFGGEKIIKVTGHSDDYEKFVLKGNEVGISIDKYNIPIDKNGNVEAGVKVSGFRPYLGLGFGRLIPKNRIGFRFELGLQFHGKPKIYADGYSEDEIKDIIDKEVDDDISKIMDKITVYPVIKLSLRGRIL